MKHSLKIFLVILVALAAGAAGVYSARRGETPAASANPAQQAALDKLLALELPDSGSASRPLAAWKGKVLVVNFWATWCPPCRKEIPAFSAMSTKYQAQGVQFVGISIDTATNVREFQARNAVSYPLVIASPSDHVASLRVMVIVRPSSENSGVLPSDFASKIAYSASEVRS